MKNVILKGEQTLKLGVTASEMILDENRANFGHFAPKPNTLYFLSVCNEIESY